MANCKACGQWFASTDPKCELCITCKRALERLKDYVAPVVRCKDCKHWETDKDYSQTAWCTFWTLDSTLLHTMATDYCSYGERKCQNDT